MCHTKSSSSTPAGKSHFGVFTNQIVSKEKGAEPALRALGFVRKAIHILQVALLELLQLLLSRHLTLSVKGKHCIYQNICWNLETQVP